MLVRTDWSLLQAVAACRKILRSRRIIALAVALIGGCVSARFTFAAAPGYSMDAVEAAFLCRFADFVSWPPRSRATPVFTVAVLHDDVLAADLERMLAHNRLKGRHARVRRITRIDQLGKAQILYIGGSDASTLRRWLAPLAGRPILIVTSQPGGLDDGSTINFLIVHRHVRFEISLAAAQRAQLEISAELLSVATRVEGRPMGLEASCGIGLPGLPPRVSCSPWLASK